MNQEQLYFNETTNAPDRNIAQHVQETRASSFQQGQRYDKENVQEHCHSNNGASNNTEPKPRPASLQLSSTGRSNSKFLGNRLRRLSGGEVSPAAISASKVLRNHFARLTVDADSKPSGKRMLSSGALRVRTPTSQFVPPRTPSAVRTLDLDQHMPMGTTPSEIPTPPSKTSPHRKGRKVIKCRRRRHRFGETCLRPRDDPLASKEILIFPNSIVNQSVDESTLTEPSTLHSTLFRPVLSEVDGSVATSSGSEQSSVYSLSAEISIGSPASAMKGSSSIPSTPSHRRRHCVDPVAWALWHNTNSVEEARETPNLAAFEDGLSLRTPIPQRVSNNFRDVHGTPSTCQIFRPIPLLARRAF